MRRNTISQLAPEEFRRLTGVKGQTFSEMVKVLQASQEAKLARGGRRPKLNTEEILLMAL